MQLENVKPLTNKYKDITSKYNTIMLNMEEQLKLNKKLKELEKEFKKKRTVKTQKPVKEQIAAVLTKLERVEEDIKDFKNKILDIKTSISVLEK
jgi:archaellum component FlaC